MARVIWPASVIDQIIQIAAYIRVFDPGSSDRIGARLIELGDSLADFPARGRPGPDGIRALLAVRPYILSYEITGDGVTILDVRHGARDTFRR